MDFEMVMVIKKEPNIPFDREPVCGKLFDGIDLGLDDLVGFSIKNGWKMSVSKLFGNVMYESFSLLKNSNCYSYHCKKCGGIFNSPVQKNTCIFCDSEEMEKQIYRARYDRSGTMQPEFNQELYSSAVKDLQEHPVPGSNSSAIDWNHLSQNL